MRSLFSPFLISSSPTVVDLNRPGIRNGSLFFVSQIPNPPFCLTHYALHRFFPFYEPLSGPSLLSDLECAFGLSHSITPLPSGNRKSFFCFLKKYILVHHSPSTVSPNARVLVPTQLKFATTTPHPYVTHNLLFCHRAYLTGRLLAPRVFLVVSLPQEHFILRAKSVCLFPPKVDSPLPRPRDSSFPPQPRCFCLAPKTHLFVLPSRHFPGFP